MSETGPDFFEGKIGLVTGGASGIGFAACQEIGSRGAEMILLDINGPAGHEAVEKLNEDGVKATFGQLDVADVSQVRRVIGQIAEETDNNIDFAFSNAGIGVGKNSLKVEPEDWDAVMNLNLRGRFFVAQSVARVMKQRNEDRGQVIGGSIVMTSSIIGLDGSPGLAAYGAANGAMVPLVRGLAVDLADEGIRVTGVAPAYVGTPLILGRLHPGHIGWLEEHTPTGRLAKPSEIAKVVAFLLSDEASYVNGETLPVTGAFRVPSMRVPRFASQPAATNGSETPLTVPVS